MNSISSALGNKPNVYFEDVQKSIKSNLDKATEDNQISKLDEHVAATLSISALSTEELEKVRKSWQNDDVSALYETQFPVQKNDEGVYRIDKVNFTEEEFGAAQSLILGMGSHLKSGYLGYRDYAKMELAENLVDKVASSNFSEEQVAVINKAMRDYNERLVRKQDSLLASTPHKTNDDPKSGKYFGIMAEIPKEVIDVHKGIYGERFSGNNLASTDVATNQNLIDEIRDSIRNIDYADKNATEKLKSLYSNLVRPAYSAQYPFQGANDVSAVIGRDVEELNKMIEFAAKWNK